ncbi:RNA polymerase sigma-70 factor [Parapedobacter sp. DT-150]
MRLMLDDDHKAYMEVYDRYADALYAYGSRKLSDCDEVKDLLQDVFAALWQNRYSLNPEKTPLAGYVYATLRYRIIKHIAHQKVEAVYFESLAAFHPENSTATDYLVREKELGQLIENEIVHLPEKTQKVFRMSRESHLSHREIAGQLGISEATVKKHVNSALKSLRLKLGALLSLLFFPFF